MSGATEEIKFSLKFLVDKERKKVIFAEAENDFVDILLSFLTLPLGTIVRLLKDDSQVDSIGSLGTLYEGLKNLDPKHFWENEYCKNLLLKPRNSSERECDKLKVNLDTKRYFKCETRNCSGSMFSPFSTDVCHCGKLMNTEIFLEDSEKCNAFVPETVTFILTDDLHVMPNSPGKSIQVLNGLGIKDMSDLEEFSHSFGSAEFLNLLKCMLFSKTPLGDLFFGEKPVISSCEVDIKTNCSKAKKMRLKLKVLKSTKKLLFCEADEEFIDFIFSFLAFPLGSAVNLLGGDTRLGCVDNLYTSVKNLSVGRDIKSSDLRKKLINPQLAFPHLSSSRIFSLKVDESSLKVNCYFDDLKGVYISTSSCYRVKDEFGKLKMKDARHDGSFVRGPNTFMVTDDLVVTNFSSISFLNVLNSLNIQFCDVEEHHVYIGRDEALNILKASLHTDSALTVGLNLNTILKNSTEETW